jgi:probable HAF family extracellular repeat protein
MKSRILTWTTAMTLFAALAIPVRLAAQDEEEQNKRHSDYAVLDLGTLGGTFATALGVNNEGWVTGFANLAGDENRHAFLWVRGAKTDLGTLGGPNSAGSLVNDRGQVVGTAETSIPDLTGEDLCGNGTKLICPPFLWQNRVMTPLPTLGGKNGSANSINKRGHVAGTAENAFPDTTCPVGVIFAQTKSVIWAREGIKELPIIDGDLDGIAASINDHGQVVGGSGNCTSLSHALLWHEGTVTDLGNLGGVLFSFASGINNQGQIVGTSDLPGDTVLRAFIWKHGVMTNLGVFPGDVHSVAVGINDKGQIVGDSCDASFSCRAVLWQNGTLTDLNSLVHDPTAPYLENGNSINLRGQIAGKTTVQGTPIADAYLAIPCDDDHSDKEGCEEQARGKSAERGEIGEKVKDTPAENVRKLLQQRLGSRYHIPSLGTPKN